MHWPCCDRASHWLRSVIWSDAASAAARSAARSLLTPALCFLAVTVLVPALNGAWSRPEGWRHSAWVTLLCAACIGAWMAACRGVAPLTSPPPSPRAASPTAHPG
jgi:hypothetical protein